MQLSWSPGTSLISQWLIKSHLNYSAVPGDEAAATSPSNAADEISGKLLCMSLTSEKKVHLYTSAIIVYLCIN